MKIVSIHEGTLPISSTIRNAWVDFSTMDVSIIAVVSDVIRDGKPLVGYGFNSNGRYSAGDILRRRVIPRLMTADPNDILREDGSNFSPEKIWDIVMQNEKPGGHGERSVAVGVLDMALFDLAAKIEDKPLYRYLSENYGDGSPDEDVFVYAAGGYYAPGKGLPELQDEMRKFLDLGYTVAKMKIGGASLAEDLRRIEAAIEVVGSGQNLAVDVNGRFDLETALTYADAIAPYNLFWYEEVGDPLDYQLQATLGERYPHPMATGENLFSLPDARNLLRYGGMRPDQDILQFDPVLGYGLVEYLRIQALLPEYGWSPRSCIPHGGHQFALHIAAALKLGGNESYPGEFFPTGGFADETVVQGGRARPTEAPGIGFELKSAFYKHLLALHG
ncbi:MULTISPECIES: mandelate racemase/muconate lactonizing enzyme family protein [unclassified Arthrobacter]|uniref:mandelate racemase/muconate lactonizing enzyme family protein n=1 Tax=unclassified Arthrobacter TaxID=235627 RepID=UPI001490C6DD|nr:MULTISPECIES: mandelate racemase/muconate lactonizing enzyme family protein [unclassified Arthrobacter]MBE0010365.1 mandelate racemase [Arthrobacter sp. AET 35A]NOJ64312.1 mandelate racemase/muconate lactonizing enzyme family protein [Arthrobacter sp. 147(2020)]